MDILSRVHMCGGLVSFEPGPIITQAQQTQ